MSKKRNVISAQLRNAVEKSGMSRYEIARGSGVTEGQLSRFVKQGSRLRLETVDKLAAFLGLSLVSSKKRKSK